MVRAQSCEWLYWTNESGSIAGEIEPDAVNGTPEQRSIKLLGLLGPIGRIQETTQESRMKKLSDPVRKVSAQTVGLDVHKTITVFCVMNAQGEMIEEGRFPSNRAEITKFIRRVLAQGETHFTFEASRSSLWGYGVMAEFVKDDHVHVAQSKPIRAIANPNSKNDANEAWWLARLTYEGRLPEAHVPALV